MTVPQDQSVFGDGISIEDTMAVVVRYNTKAILTYSLNTYMPWGRLSGRHLTAPRGAIQVHVCEKKAVSRWSTGFSRKAAEEQGYRCIPHV